MKQTPRILAAASSFALLAVALMIWSLFDPRPIPVVVAMSVGQLLGTLSLLAFVYVVFADWRAQMKSAAQPELGTRAADASLDGVSRTEVPR